MTTHESTVAALPRSRPRKLRQLWRAWTAPGKVFYASTMLANAVGYVYFFVMARLLGVESYGELVTLTALVYVFSVVTRTLQAKLAQAVTAQRSADPNVRPDEAAVMVLKQSIRPLLLGTVLIIGLAALLSWPLARFLRLGSVLPAVILGVYVATHYLLAAPRGLLLGSGRLYYLSLVTFLDPVVRVLVSVALVLEVRSTSSALVAYVAGNLIATLLAALPFAWLALSGVRKAVGPNLRLLTYDRLFLLALFVNGALMALPSADPVAVRRFFSDEVSGTYAAAFLLGRVILLSTNAASWVVFSRVVHLRPNDPRARRVLLRGLALSGGIAGLVASAYAIAPRLAARAMGGAAYTGAASFVGLVGLEMVVFSFVSVLAYYHIAMRNERVWLPFALALVAEAVILATFHATPYQVPLDTLMTLTGLLAWLGLETRRSVHAPAPSSGERSRRLCMVVHSHYPADPRVRREAEALLANGWEVDVICLPDGHEPAHQEVRGARVWRMPVQRNRFGSQLNYLGEYGRFFIAATLQLARLHARRPFGVVQVHNMPDFLVFVALWPKLLGARVVLDVHDLVPEFYALRYRRSPRHPSVRLARWVQRLSARFADHVLAAGEPFRRQLIANGVRAEKITSIMNSPDPELFGGQPVAHAERADGKFVLCYHGTLSEYNDLSVVLRAMTLLRDETPDLVFRVYGRGRSLPELQVLAAELRLNGSVQFMGYQPLDQMASAIAAADLGLTPQRRSDFTALNYPTKAFEYIACGVPVLMSQTPALSELFGHIDGIFFRDDRPEELAELIRACRDGARRQAIVSQEQAVCATFAWPTEARRYVGVINSLATVPQPWLEAVAA